MGAFRLSLHASAVVLARCCIFSSAGEERGALRKQLARGVARAESESDRQT